MNVLPLAGLLALSLTACSKAPDAPQDRVPATAEATATAPPGTGSDANLAGDADMATRSPVDLRGDSPARLDGFGAIALGATVDEVRGRFGAPLQGEVPDDDCHYLRPEKESAEGPWLMFESKKLVRYDVRGPGIVAPGGGRVGMTLGELQQLYPERADVGPDKYDAQAQHLRVRPAQEGQAIMDFTVAADGKVGAWRVGKPPQVDYVEGCG